MNIYKKIQTVDDYIGGFPLPIKKILEEVRTTVKMAAPKATEFISYRMPAYRMGNSRTLVYFAAFTHHIGFYPTSSGVRQFEKELSKYKHSKGAIQFPIDKPIPYDLIEKIVRFRVKETEK